MVILLMVVLLIGSVFLVFWNILMFLASKEHEKEAADYAYRAGKVKFTNLYEKYTADTAVLERTDGIAHRFYKLLHNPKSSEKKAEKIQKKLDKYEQKNYKGINIFVLPGYAFIKLLGINADMRFFANIMKLYSELNGRENTAADTRYLLASMISCAIGGIGFSITLGFLFVALGKGDFGWILCVGGPVFSVLLAGTMYSGVKSKLKSRREDIMSDFPQVVTEIALLTSSGMEMFRAWREVSKEHKGTLYREMRQTSAELFEYGVEPSLAFENFIRRCGTKETARLGTSILQNLTRGNAELSNFLTELSREAWEERKHNARRLGETAESKLMLPMMIIFIGILLLIAVPVIMSLSSMGM